MAAKTEKPKVLTERDETWAQVIRNSLGRDRVKVPHSQNSPNLRENTRDHRRQRMTTGAA